MATIYDMLELNGVPQEGFILGPPGTGADVEFLLTETTAEVADDYYDNMLSATVPSGFHVDSYNAQTVVIDGETYATSGLFEVVYEMDGTTYSGFVAQMTPSGGGDVRTFFLPQDGLGQTDIGQITIVSIDSIGFMDSDSAATDDTVQFLVCFAAGTRLATPAGYRLVEALAEGDLVCTLDHGDLPVLWAQMTEVPRARAARDHRLQLVQIAPGAFAPGVPARGLRVSRQHRVVVQSPIAARMFGAEEVLVAAKDLLDLPGVQLLTPEADIQVHHLLLPVHSVLLAEGLGAESLWLGEEAARMLGPATVARMQRRLYAPQSPARPIVSGGPAQRMIRRHAKNRRGLCQSGGVLRDPEFRRAGDRGLIDA